MNRSKLVTLFVLSSAAGCGVIDNKKDDSSDGDSSSDRVGVYRLGDRVKYKVEREGYSLTEFFITGEVTDVSGLKVQIKWTDSLDRDGLQLRDIDDNPYIEEIDFANQYQKPVTTGKTFQYEPEELIEIEALGRTFPCLKMIYTIEEDDKTRRVERCKSSQIAIDRDVYLQVSYLNDQGDVDRHWRRTLIENVKN